MADYRLYILGPDQHVRRSVEFVAEGDNDAVALARNQLDGEAAELWNLGRKVKTFRGPPGSEGSPEPGPSTR